MDEVELEEDQAEIELNDEEAPFLIDQTTKTGHSLNPVKISKNPDGSLSRAAMSQAKKAKERKDIRDMDKTKTEQSAAQNARNMVQAIRNMYSSNQSTAAESQSQSNKRGGGPSREGDRPEWASAMSNKDYYRTSQSTYTCS